MAIIFQSYAQSLESTEPGNGGEADPAICPKLPFWNPDPFDWTQDSYTPFNLIDNTVNANAIPNPYKQTQNNNMVPLSIPADNVLDMDPHQGWVLVKKNWGYEDDGSHDPLGAEAPFMLLYNRYRGILRFFVCLGTNHLDANAITVQM